MLKSFILIIALIYPAVSRTQKASVTRPAITGISHVTLYADDISKSRQFYVSLLGWDPVPANDASPGIRFYANHAQYIELLSPPKQRLANRLDIIAFSTSNAEALRKFLGSNGVIVPNVVTREQDGSQNFITHDPEGNKIEFTQEGDHFPAVPESVSRRLSSHIIHAGYVVRNRAALDHFYKDLLGFHLYWQGGYRNGDIDWVMMQVPNGTDWIEYMLYLPVNASRAQLGSANHFAPGVVSVAQLQKRLEQRGWKAANNKNPQVLGVDGKLQLDLVDPDGTRVEFMEFTPIKKPCCSPYTGRQPIPSTAW